MTIEINGMNLDDIKDAQDILAAFLTLQLQTEKSIENVASILNQNAQILDYNKDTYCEIRSLFGNVQEIQKKQEFFTKNQRTEQENLTNKIHEFSKIFLEENTKLYQHILQQNEELQKHTESAVCEILAKVDFASMTKEVERSFQAKFTNLKKFNDELERLMLKTDKNIDLLTKKLEKFNQITNESNIFGRVLNWAIFAGIMFTIGVYHEPVFSFAKELFLSVI